jgi:hypothetical protein
VRYWIYYTFAAKTAEGERAAILAQLPPAMAERLAIHLNEGVLSNLPIFEQLSGIGCLRGLGFRV